jgi:hypothetical protein
LMTVDFEDGVINVDDHAAGGADLLPRWLGHGGEPMEDPGHERTTVTSLAE